MQIVVVENAEKGIEKAKEILYEKVDKRTVLFLSGGKTPKPLYEIFAKEKVINPAAVGMIDERYGYPGHKNSNELMIRNTGFVDYLGKRNIPFYPMLKMGVGREGTAYEYDKVTRDLFFNFPRSVAVMGIGTDYHIAGIAPDISEYRNPLNAPKKKHLFVSEYDDRVGKYKERVTMTFAGLALIDYFIVLVFGEDKKELLEKALTLGSIEDVPARFFQEMASKNTLIITDQRV